MRYRFIWIIYCVINRNQTAATAGDVVLGSHLIEQT